MKYCKHCGNQIPDNAVCNCPGAVAERQAQGGYQQPYQAQGYQQPGYAAPARPRPANSPMNGFAGALKGYFQSPLKTVRDRQRAKDFITPLIVLGIMFFLLWGVNSCIFGNQAVVIHRKVNNVQMFGDKLFAFNFGFVVLASLIETLTMALSYIGAKLVISLIFVKPINPGKFFTDAFISFGVNSFVPLIAMVIGGLFYMALGILAQIFFAFAFLWYVAVGLAEVYEEVPAQNKNFVFFLTVICVVALMAFGYIMMYKLMWQMNMGHTVEETNAMVKAVQSAESNANSVSNASGGALNGFGVR